MRARSFGMLAIAVIVTIFSANILFAGNADSLIVKEQVLKNCVSVGILQGGGALIGADYERLLVKNVAVSDIFTSGQKGLDRSDRFGICAGIRQIDERLL